MTPRLSVEIKMLDGREDTILFSATDEEIQKMCDLLAFGGPIRETVWEEPVGFFAWAVGTIDWYLSEGIGRDVLTLGKGLWPIANLHITLGTQQRDIAIQEGEIWVMEADYGRPEDDQVMVIRTWLFELLNGERIKLDEEIEGQQEAAGDSQP